jgi:hypothetical protein
MTRDWWDRDRLNYDLCISQLVLDECAAGDPGNPRNFLEFIRTFLWLGLPQQSWSRFFCRQVMYADISIWQLPDISMWQRHCRMKCCHGRESSVECFHADSERLFPRSRQGHPPDSCRLDDSPPGGAVEGLPQVATNAAMIRASTGWHPDAMLGLHPA